MKQSDKALDMLEIELVWYEEQVALGTYPFCGQNKEMDAPYPMG